MHHDCGASTSFKRFACTIGAVVGHCYGRRIQGETAWQRMVVSYIGFDPETHYPQSFMQLVDLGTEDPKWQTFSVDNLRRPGSGGTSEPAGKIQQKIK